MRLEAVTEVAYFYDAMMRLGKYVLVPSSRFLMRAAELLQNQSHFYRLAVRGDLHDSRFTFIKAPKLTVSVCAPTVTFITVS